MYYLLKIIFRWAWEGLKGFLDKALKEMRMKDVEKIVKAQKALEKSFGKNSENQANSFHKSSHKDPEQ